MVSSQGDRTASSSDSTSGFSRPARTRQEILAQMDTEQLFRLIDSILPFEACLYHQILPLTLEGSRLRLGMVNLDDATALDYVRRILAYMNCSLVPQSLSSEVHHAVLSAYLSYTGNQQTQNLTGQPRLPQRTSSSSTSKRSRAATAPGVEAKHPERPTAGGGETKAPPGERADANSKATLLVDSPEELSSAEMEQLMGQRESVAATPEADKHEIPQDTVHQQIAHPSPLSPVPEAEAQPLITDNFASDDTVSEADLSEDKLTEAEDTVPSVIVLPEPEGHHLEEVSGDNQPSNLPRPEEQPTSPSLSPIPMPPPFDGPPLGDALPTLQIETHHLTSPVEVLVTLPPAALLQELLARVLMSGIGRLYFEQQKTSGRVLWSQNGVLQSVLDSLPLPVFQGLIHELKLLTHLPLTPIQNPQQVEIERLYQRTRLLLRLRVMPGNFGEDATLQVLRGAALKFYQQQQLTNLSRDAIGIAQELQKKVNEIRQRTQFSTALAADQLNLLPTLNQVIREVEQQLEDLRLLALAARSQEQEEQSQPN